MTFIGSQIGSYTIDAFIAEGAVGSVYKAVRSDIGDVRACKFIHTRRNGWQNEITKVLRLRGVPQIVQYIEHGELIHDGHPYLWIQWEYIDGINLKTFATTGRLTIPLLLNVVREVLRVLAACQHHGIIHGDLHWGNIILQTSADSAVPADRLIRITDFAYCTCSMGLEILDDFDGLARIISDSLALISYHTLGPADRIQYAVLKDRFPYYLHQTSQVEHESARNAAELLRTLDDLLLRASKGESPVPTDESRRSRRIDDYLNAENLGERWDEWKDLFVSECLGINELIGFNTIIFTGMRGCGKSMVFRRLSAKFVRYLGALRGIDSGEFIGIYVNARNIAEAFPWLPESKEADARNQILHYFHVCIALELLNWLIDLPSGSIDSTQFRNIVAIFQDVHKDSGVDLGNTPTLDDLRLLLEKERERGRLQSEYRPEARVWPYSRMDFIVYIWERLSVILSSVVGSKPLYCLIDDYTLPMVSHPIQRILNPVIFSRSAAVFFKVATEDVWSFNRTGLGGKYLEEDNDFKLVNLSTESLLLDRKRRMKLLAGLLEPRIRRNSKYSSDTLLSMLGSTPYTFIELAWALRNEFRGAWFEGNKKAIYCGIEIFSSMWSGDTREMIRIFSLMAEDAASDFEEPGSGGESQGLVSGKIPFVVQDRILREAGGIFINSRLAAGTNPLDAIDTDRRRDRSFGDRLCKIASALQDIMRHELRNFTSENEGRVNPKQVRKIEIRDSDGELPEDIEPYYLALLRYGVLIRDNRGKSVRRTIAPRLVLRGLLVPYFTVSPSKRDSATMAWSQFVRLLREPEEAARDWISNRRKEESPSLSAEPLPFFGTESGSS